MNRSDEYELLASCPDGAELRARPYKAERGTLSGGGRFAVYDRLYLSFVCGKKRIGVGAYSIEELTPEKRESLIDYARYRLAKRAERRRARAKAA
jgi:hypothetical protein